MRHKSSKNDLSIDGIVRFRKLEGAFLERCRQFGYNEIKTSTIEPLYIFTALGALSEKKLRRMYSFIDWDGWSGERVALKPDSTTCVARFYGDHLHKENSRRKLCYVENHFEWADSWDEISERWQFGIENIGTRDPESDIEVIYLGLDILRDTLDTPTYLFLSYPSIIRDVIRLLDLDETAEKKLVAAIRNRDEDTISEILATSTAGADTVMDLKTLIRRPSDQADYSVHYLENLATLLQPATYECIRPAYENFMSICKRLDSLGCDYFIDFTLIGDLEYYTGIQFQILSTAARKSRKDILCSGGRYDNLIGKMWDLPESVPSVGFALFVRNILAHVPSAVDKLQNIAIYIKNIAGHNVKTAQDLCGKLSELGFSARITFSPVPSDTYESYGLVIEVDHDTYPDGFQVLFSQKIGKPLLMNLFGGFNGK